LLPCANCLCRGEPMQSRWQDKKRHRDKKNNCRDKPAVRHELLHHLQSLCILYGSAFEKPGIAMWIITGFQGLWQSLWEIKPELQKEPRLRGGVALGKRNN
jgi:hypothetical protein